MTNIPQLSHGHRYLPWHHHTNRYQVKGSHNYSNLGLLQFLVYLVDSWSVRLLGQHMNTITCASTWSTLCYHGIIYPLSRIFVRIGVRQPPGLWQNSRQLTCGSMISAVVFTNTRSRSITFGHSGIQEYGIARRAALLKLVKQYREAQKEEPTWQYHQSVNSHRNHSDGIIKVLMSQQHCFGLAVVGSFPSNNCLLQFLLVLRDQ